MTTSILKLQKEVKDARKLYFSLLQTNFQKDMTIASLDSQLNMRDDGAPSAGPEPFKRFADFFNENDLVHLRGIDHRSASDSTFIRQSLKFLYRNNLHVLSNKSAKGNKNKESITPQKMMILSNIFDERVSGMDLVEHEKRRRKLNFGRLIARAISNIRKRDLPDS